MPESEFLGRLIEALVVIVGLFFTIVKPLMKNTEAMTNLNATMNQLSERISENKQDLKEHEQEFEEYKEKVRTSQKRQWDVIDNHGEKLIDHEHRLQLVEKKQEENRKEV